MANTRELVTRRKSVRNTRKITKTMEMVSTAKLAKAQNRAIASRPYAQQLQKVIGDLASASGDVKHPLLEAHANPKKAVIVVMTSDRGLCGGFNVHTIAKAVKLKKEIEGRGLEVEFVMHGKKGMGSFRYQGIEYSKSYAGVSDKPDYRRAEEIANDLIIRYAESKIDEAYVVYSRFKSMVNQVATSEKILPLSGLKTEGESEPKPGSQNVDYLYHPDPLSILTEVLPLVVKMSVFSAMLDNTAGEHAARRLAMKNATDAADDMIVDLTRAYNRARQSKITQEIAEIVGGAEAL